MTAMGEPGATHRSVRIPRLMRIVDGASDAAAALGELGAEREGPLLMVHSGGASPSGYGPILAREAGRGRAVEQLVVDAADGDVIDAIGRRIAELEPAYVVGVGGGRVVDVAKLAAHHAGSEFVSVPTQASSDGICSPVAVIRSRDGRPQSIGARIPTGIVVDMEVLSSAPLLTWQSGLGDLISNVSAVRDWREAHELRGEEIDDFACLTSEAAARSVIEDDADLASRDYRQKLIRGLILSGIAMEMAGSSRPASGSEHLISHALDELLERPRLHGLQVALGTVAATILRGDDPRPSVRFHRSVGLPVTPGDVGLGLDQLAEAVRRAPGTRPGRITFLSEVTDGDLARLRTAYAELA